MPCSIKFCAMFCAVSCTASIEPVFDALTSRSVIPLTGLTPNRPMSRSIGSRSVRPGKMPYAVAELICSGVVPACWARCRASPAPIAIAIAARTGVPPGTKNDPILPTPSNIWVGIVSSYPGAAWGESRLASSLTRLTTGFSISSGSNAAAPTAADSNPPINPRGIALSASLACPAIVVLTGLSFRYVKISSCEYPSFAAPAISNPRVLAR